MERHRLRRTRSPRRRDRPMTLECDILIIGSGAAGGVLAATLERLTSGGSSCRKGRPLHERFFNQREWDMNVLYAEPRRPRHR